MTLLNELMFREIDLPDLIPDVIPQERKPSGPMEESDVEFEEDNVEKNMMTSCIGKAIKLEKLRAGSGPATFTLPR